MKFLFFKQLESKQEYNGCLISILGNLVDKVLVYTAPPPPPNPWGYHSTSTT